jgi:hypothetical protein
MNEKILLLRTDHFSATFIDPHRDVMLGTFNDVAIMQLDSVNNVGYVINFSCIMTRVITSTQDCIIHFIVHRKDRESPVPSIG